MTATSAGELPKEAWVPTLVRTVGEFMKDELHHRAAALTYYSALSLFPVLVVLVSLARLIADPDALTKFLTNVVDALGPASAADTFRSPIESIAHNRTSAVVMAVIGVAAALWSASGYVSAFTAASNMIYEVEEGRPLWRLKPLQLLVSFICVSLAAITALALVLSGPLARAIGDAIGLSDVALSIWQYGRWPAMLVVVFVILHVLHLMLPNAEVRRPLISRGVVLTLVVWIVASVGFAVYVANFSAYDEIYGSMAGVVVFLLWLWLTNIAVLLGVEFNAETERTREMRAGVGGAEGELKLPERERQYAAPGDPGTR